ncbi:hypothetical protein JDN40_01490 [Rhodomicrobium vannielii ATCC 17100]|uniref:hypothetical protein n=1 Tax=Rhodomicrobium vannielii TaxID=1069 RepID=UPI001919B650|nr:hypothetical protein [Rhodomicrobium vannielii]MBJ7532793.1 hypothetical protein [Rhodomicrobium vannielii ATCC 17100]
MTKTNFDKMAKLPMFARPPLPDDGKNPFAGYGAVRAADGRTARKTGRNVQFATVVTSEFKRWLKTEAASKSKTMAALLDDMKAAYIEKYGE